MGITGTPHGAAAATRLRAVQSETGLDATELGVARLYHRPHRSGRTDGHLTGVEILVKDLQRVAGETTGFGSPAHEAVADQDDATVRHLLATGATLVGASVTAEFGATVYTEPAVVGGGPGPVNPVDPRMTAGGSSSGAAVAVARGIVDIAHANDAGGSIRVPAAAVGLPGLKPAHRVFGDTAGTLPNPTAQGYIAASLPLTALAYRVADGAGATEPPSGLHVGMTTTPFHGDPGQSGPTGVDPFITAAATAASALLATHPRVTGVIPAPAPYPVDRFSVFSRVMAARCAGLPEPLGPVPAWLKARGKGLSAVQLDDAVSDLRALPGDICRVWPDLDVIVTPTLACAPPPVGVFSALSAAGAPRLDFLAQTAWTPWATLWNLTGWAGLTVPLVPAEPGRWPVSVHLGAVSDRVDAATLIALGSYLQSAVADLIGGDSGLQDAFVLTEPGDIETLHYRPVPAGHAHTGHGDCHAG